MPLGVDHVQFSVPSLDGGADFLRSHGFRQDFAESGFDGEGAPFFRERGKSMTFHSTDTTRIELVNAAQGGQHGVAHDTYVPVFDPDGDLVNVAALAAPCRGAVSTRLLHIEVHVDDLEASLRFWRVLGFREEGAGSRMTFPASIAGVGLAIEFRRRRTTRPSGLFVDDPGCSLIALVDRDCEATLEALRGSGSLWASHGFRIKGRPVRVHILSGPGGELVELIHFLPRG